MSCKQKRFKKFIQIVLLFFIFIFITLFFSISIILSCSIKDAKINYFYLFLFSYFIFYKPRISAVSPYLFFIFTSIPSLFINSFTTLSSPFHDAKIHYCFHYKYFNFILYKPLCNAVSPLLSFILTSIPPFINISTILSCPFHVAKIYYFYLF